MATRGTGRVHAEDQDSTSLLKRILDRRSVVSQTISLGVHIMLLVAIVLWIRSSPARDQVIPADVDVVEFEDPQLAAGPVDAMPSEVDLGRAEEVEAEVVEPPDTVTAPRIELPPPEAISEEIPLPALDPANRQAQLSKIDAAIEQLNQNVARAGGGDDADDPNSRGSQQARWTIRFESGDCAQFGRMLLDIGIKELAVVSGDGELTYIHPVTGDTRRGRIAGEDRLHWQRASDVRVQCMQRIVERAGFGTRHIIGFMDRADEQRYEEIEARYADAQGFDLARIRQTVFVPRKTDGRWKPVVNFMR